MKDLDQLVSAARALDAPIPDGAERRIWAAVVASPASAAPLAASASGIKTLLFKVGLGVVLVGGTVGAVAYGRLGPTATPPELADPDPPASAPHVPEPQPAASLRPLEPALEPATATSSSSEPPASRRPRRTRAPVPDESSTGDLTEETRILRAAKVALAQRKPEAARELLAEHRRRFPGGELVELRMALDVSTACALGQSRQAATARARFLTRFPHSALEGRVRQGCSEGDPSIAGSPGEKIPSTSRDE